ncbi:hypothetical protein Bca4012_074723 [Brassica carinata]
MSLPDLPDDVLAIIFGKVGESSYEDYAGCMLSCKTFQRLSKYPEVLQKLDLTKAFPPPWERIPNASNILYECAQFRNVHAIFLCGLIDYYFVKPRVTGINNLKMAADAGHCEAMYLYGMALIYENQLTEGSNYIKKLWRERGFQVVRQCQENCSRVVLDMSVREYRVYEKLFAEIDVSNECVVGELDEVCDGCFIYKEIFRFIDYMQF